MRGSKVEALLSQAPKGERVQTTLKLDKHLYEGLQAVCVERGISASAVVDAMLEDLLATIRPSAPKKAKAGPVVQ